MNTLQILIEARKLIEKPERWIQHDYARDADGGEVTPDDSDATCFCMLGALARSAHAMEHEAHRLPAALVLSTTVGGRVHHWNDDPDRTHAEVLAAFDRAIARASTESESHE